MKRTSVKTIIKVQYVRVLFILTSLVTLVLAVGFFFQMDWAKATWPWPDGRLSYIFLSSILIAIAAPMLWISLTGE